MLRLAAFWLVACHVVAAPLELYISPKGDDEHPGNREKPFATLDAAIAAARKARPAEGTTIIVEDGTYTLQKPVAIIPREAADADLKIAIAAAPNARPVFSGGRRLTGWKVRDGRWELELPEVKAGTWDFIDLFVSGERRPRPRLPKKGWYNVAADLPRSENAPGPGFDAFKFKPGDLQPSWTNLRDVELLVPRSWVMNRFRIGSIEQDVVRFTGTTPNNAGHHKLNAGLPYLVENAREALDTPGRWYLDKPKGLLTYLPRPGEDPEKAEVVAPMLDHWISLQGTAEQPVGGIVFRGLRFAHTAWQTPPKGHSFPQAEADVPAAVRLLYARRARFEGCDFTLTGGYGVDFGAGTRECVLDDCELTHLGAGGIRIGGDGRFGRPKTDDAPEVAGWNTVKNCLLAHGGRLHAAAVGVWIGHSPHNTIEHCDITDFYYTGVSLGWSWGYAPSGAHHNTIAFCHISKIGQEVLSDMGGIYTLGNGPGNVLRGNHIHDVACRPGTYGGWGLYHDEGSTAFLSEDNIIHHTSSATFHQHYGRENVVRNNIFACSTEGGLARSRDESHVSFIFERNIILTKGKPFFVSSWKPGVFRFSKNLYWDAANAMPKFPIGKTFSDWQQHDAGAVLADPGFENAEAGNFRLAPNSPALALGFKPLDPAHSGRKSPRRSPHADPPRAWPAP